MDKKIGFIGVTTPQTLSKTYLHNIVDEDGKMLYDFLAENEGQELYNTFFAWEIELTRIWNITRQIEQTETKISRLKAYQNFIAPNKFKQFKGYAVLFDFVQHGILSV